MINIEQEFLEIVRTQFNRKNNAQISLQSDIRKELGIDSLSFTELILACEDHFNIRIESEDEILAEAKTLQPLYDTIVRYLDQSGSTK